MEENIKEIEIQVSINHDINEASFIFAPKSAQNMNEIYATHLEEKIGNEIKRYKEDVECALDIVRSSEEKINEFERVIEESKSKSETAEEKVTEIENSLTNYAKTNFENITTEGEAKFVNTSGDKMTGALEIYNNLDVFGANNEIDWTSTTAPSSDISSGWLVIRDKNSNAIGELSTIHTTSNDFVTLLATLRNINGTVKISTIGVVVSPDGTPFATAPTPAAGDNSNKIATTAFCKNMATTTKPTTTSTASDTRPAWVVQNYLNGTSWYRVWSDGFCEQGCATSNGGNATQTITFLKPYTSTPTVIVSPASTTGTSGYNNILLAVSNTSFQMQSRHSFGGWVAYGYIN